MIKTLQISENEAWDLAFNALVNNQTSEDNAREVADALMSAEFDGQSGHGLSRIPSYVCLLYTSPSPRDLSTSRMPSSA